MLNRLFQLKHITIVILSLTVFACNDVTPVKQQDNSQVRPSAYMPRVITDGAENANQILIKFKSDVGGASRSRALNNAGLTQSGTFSLVPGLTLAQPQPGLTVLETLNNLVSDPLVAYAEPDYLLSAMLSVNDPDYSNQYGLNNTGQNGGTANADISIEAAWDTQTGADIIVAVIDSGVDYTHQDLSANMWTNVAEIPGNRIDDDNNGYVDDVRGWNFSGNNNNPMDDNNHGTHIAGVIGAKSNNGIGVTGINWNVKIMPLKFMYSGGQGRTSSAINALEYAIANGAKISNNSWGGGSYSQALFDAIQAANRAGHLFVAASGNDGSNNDRTAHYPTSYNLPNIISVGASDNTDSIANFSNFGSQTVDLLAPGVSVYSTIRNNGYRSMSGTSMATPFVTGVAALLLAERSDLPLPNLKSAILDNTDTIAAAGNTVSGGRLNAFSALSAVTALAPVIPPTDVTPTLDPAPISAPTTPPTQPTITEVTITPNIINVAIGASAQLSATGGVEPYTWSVDKSAYANIDPDTGVFTGLTVGTVLVTVIDSAGSQSASYLVNLVNMQILPDPFTEVLLAETKILSANGGTGPYLWSVSDTTVVEITNVAADGSEITLTPLKVGSFEVTLTDSSQNTAVTGAVSVLVEPLALSPTQADLLINETLQLIASGGTSPYTWSTSNTNIASVDGGGLLMAKSSGDVTITVTDSAEKSLSVLVSVGGALTINTANTLFSPNETIQLAVSGGDGNYQWFSSNDAIATVDNTGFFTAVAADFVTISVTDGLGQTDSVDIEIREVTVTSPVSNVAAGDPGFIISANGGSGNITWTVSRAALAAIDSTGFFNPIAEGTVTVTATDADGFFGSVDITITALTATPTPDPAPAPTTPVNTNGGHH